jgi:hypothetical protein
MWHGSLFEQLPNTQRRGLPFSHSHTKQKQKEELKLKTPKTILRKLTKKKKKQQQQEKIEINRIIKN